MQIDNVYDIAKNCVDWSNFVFDCTPTKNVFMSLNGRERTLWSKDPFQMAFWKKMFVCLSAWLFFESADARDLGLMTLFDWENQSVQKAVFYHF